MKTHNPENERTKRDYFGYLKNARGLNETSIDAAAKGPRAFRGEHAIQELQGVSP